MTVSAIVYEPKEGDPLMTAAEYARHKGVSRAAVSKMVKRHGIKLDQERRAPKSVWLAADAAGLALDKNTESARAANSPEGSVANQAAKMKLKKLTLEAQLLEHELAEAQGRTVTKEEHRGRLQAMCGLCIRLIDAVASNWAAEVRDPSQFAKLQEGIDGAKRTILAELEAGA